jgi:hypothetical protein
MSDPKATPEVPSQSSPCDVLPPLPRNPEIVVRVTEIGDDGLSSFERVLLTLVGQLLHNTAKIANANGTAGCYMEPDIDGMLGFAKQDAEKEIPPCH